ncbi:hypothetical protein L210DRAFT_3522801 [Boletus edulis BED1]|uniref:DUF4470 domain-containing protein n=1 Tax=Boletus edulis BED1 TaxID=1328754 RepID=A0AAD4C3Z2_BOLED|nr:hypothetical protein L210DRAFT_3522801 [Boletus edulis BED1]
MSHPLFWPTVIYFYPIGNTSAVCLTENLSPESKADILLLACGDPRHILYTIYTNECNPLTSQRTFDITCCDVDVAILARNTLLFTLLADDGVLDKLDKLWTLFYHIFIDQASLSVLSEQCRKLITLAESAETWQAGPYGHFLTTCDTATRVALRRVWSTYLDTASFSSKQARRFEQRIVDGMKEMSRNVGSGRTTTAARSAGPLAPHVMEAVSHQFRNYWSAGSTDDSAQGQGRGPKRRLSVNPTFAFSIDGDKFSVHYGTGPLSGFHLAEAFASGKFTRLHENIPPHEVVRVAKSQFYRWCTSMNKRLKSNNPSSSTFVIRMFAGDALMFCQALKYCEVTQSPVTPYNVGAWRLSTITLDDRAYGRNPVSQAPLSFNVIDTSNILDHAGLINVLVVTAPLLCKTPSATLYTEALLRTGDDPSQAILEHLCGDLATMALLLGIIPTTFISQFTTRSNVHEILTMSEGAKQYHERLSWKVIGFEGPRTQDPDDARRSSLRLCFAPEDLAAFLFRVYVHMFPDEDIESRFQLLTLSPERLRQTLQRCGILHYNRRSFGLLVHFVKTRVQTDWWRAMNMFEDLVMTDRRLITGQHAYQELCCQLHLLGVYTTEWMSVPALDRLRLEHPGGTAAPFRDWTPSRIPQVVTLVLVVPRDAIAQLEPDFKDVGTPELLCDMHDGPRQNWFAVTSATFGSLRVSGTGEHRTGVIVQGSADAGTDAHAMQPPWRTKAPLIITFSVAASSVIDFARNPMATVALALRASVGVTVKFSNRLGLNLTVFRTQLTNAERVFVLARRPVVAASESTSTGRDAGVAAGAVTAGHWQENTREELYSEEATSRANMPHETHSEVHVQLDDMSSAVQSFTVRIDVTDPNARTALANSQTVPTVNSGSGSTLSLDARVRIGVHPFTVQFPLPVDIARAKLRVARRSSYIEVVAPLAPFHVRPERDLLNRFAPLPSGPDDDSTPMLGSIHRLNLDRCPTFKLPKGPSTFDWCDLHINLMFSGLEKKRLSCAHSEPPSDSSILASMSTPDTLLHLKQTLHVLLGAAAGAAGKTPEKVFGLCDTSRHGVPYLYIVVACVRLDVGSHTVVADTFVALTTPAVRVALGIADVGIRFILTDADETAAWFHLLPRLTERCRTWPHKTSCAYRTRAKQPDERTTGTWERQSPLCTCGAGVGTKILPKAFERVAPYLTRAAFSPLFSVPYLKEVDVPVAALENVPGKMKPWKAAHKTSLNERNADVGKTHATGGKYQCRSCGKEGGLACSRCKRARYCSKDHKKNCGGALEAV